jgi:hypothetical protein
VHVLAQLAAWKLAAHTPPTAGNNFSDSHDFFQATAHRAPLCVQRRGVHEDDENRRQDAA